MNTRLISLYLKSLRKEKGYSQKRLAEELNLSRQAVSKWETGTTIPDLDVLLQLSKLYQCSINNLLEPQITTSPLEDFEQILTLPEAFLLERLSTFQSEEIAKALMGASPAVNDYIADIFRGIDFKMLQNEIGRIKVTEVETLQSQIISILNLP